MKTVLGNNPRQRGNWLKKVRVWLNGTPGYSSQSDIRITEDGDMRITESGDYRILE
jgi:hypothetical protein